MHTTRRHTHTHAYTHTHSVRGHAKGPLWCCCEPGLVPAAGAPLGSGQWHLRHGHTAGTAWGRQRVTHGSFTQGCCGHLPSTPSPLLPAAVLRPRLGHQNPHGQSQRGRSAAAGVPLPSSPASPIREELCPNCDPWIQGYFTDSDRSDGGSTHRHSRTPAQPPKAQGRGFLSCSSVPRKHGSRCVNAEPPVCNGLSRGLTAGGSGAAGNTSLPKGSCGPGGGGGHLGLCMICVT